jgi:hypothetical protein
VHVLDLDKSTGDFIYRLFNIYYETKRNINDLIYIFFFQSSTFIIYDVSYSSIMSIRSGMVFGHFFFSVPSLCASDFHSCNFFFLSTTCMIDQVDLYSLFDRSAFLLKKSSCQRLQFLIKYIL